MRAHRTICLNCLGIALFIGVSSEAIAKRPIRYNMSDIPASGVTQLGDTTLDVEPFADDRQSVPENQIVFTADRKTKIDGKTVCVNSEKDYGDDVGKQLSTTISAHFKKRGSFKDVLMGSKSTADYYLQGTVRQFYGRQDFSAAKAVGSGFGLLGMGATAGIKTLGVVRVQFTNLKLMDRNGTLVKAFNDIDKSFEGEFPADANCLMTHVNVLEKMKEAIQVFADEVERTIVERKAGTGDEKSPKATVAGEP